MKKVLLLLFLLSVYILPVIAVENKPIITVLDFSSDGVSESEMKSIINFLSSSLFKTGKFTVIDVSQRENILNELEFSMSGCTDESCYLEVGKMLSAEGIVVGSIGRVGSRFLLTAKLLETETGATKSSADGMYTNLDELLDDVSRVATDLGAIYVGTASDTIEAEDSQPAEIENEAAKVTREIRAVPEKNKTTDIKKREPVDINFPAWGTLVGAAGCLGTSGYFLAVSLPLMFDYLDTQAAYDGATEATAAAELYTTAEAARAAAIDGNVNTFVPLGAGLAAAGLGLGVLSTILFILDADDAEPPVQAAFLPAAGGVQLSFTIHPWEKY